MNLKALGAIGLLVVGIGAVAVTVVGIGSSPDASVTYRTSQATTTTVQQTAAASGSLVAATVYDLAFGEIPAATSGTSTLATAASSASSTATTGASSTTSSAGSSDTGGGSLVVTWPVTAVNVAVGDLVKAGDVLAVADDATAQLAVRVAEADLAAARAQRNG